MLRNLDESDLLAFIIDRRLQAGDRLPPLEELSAELQISISKLREQLEVARVLGLVGGTNNRMCSPSCTICPPLTR